MNTEYHFKVKIILKSPQDGPGEYPELYSKLIKQILEAAIHNSRLYRSRDEVKVAKKKLFNTAKDAYAFIQRHQIRRWELIAKPDPDFRKATKCMKAQPEECILLRYNWRKVFLLSLILKGIYFLFDILDLDYDNL